MLLQDGQWPEGKHRYRLEPGGTRALNDDGLGPQLCHSRHLQLSALSLYQAQTYFSSPQMGLYMGRISSMVRTQASELVRYRTGVALPMSSCVIMGKSLISLNFNFLVCKLGILLFLLSAVIYWALNLSHGLKYGSDKI